MFVADLHCDTMFKLWISGLQGKKYSFKDTSGNTEPFQIDVRKLQSGGYVLQNFALYVDMRMPASMLAGKGESLIDQMPGAAMSAPETAAGDASYVDPWFQVTEMLRIFRKEMADNSSDIRQVRTWEDIEENRRAGRVSALLTIEEGGVLQGEISRLDQLREAGVRMMTVTWNYPNGLGYPNRIPEGTEKDFRNYYRFRPETGNGLTAFGKEAVSRMEELGILPDVSHLSDAGIFDVADVVKGPFVASHSNARALCGCSRNLTDDMIRIIAEHGGVIGLNFCPSFLVEADREEKCFTSCEALARHARHIMNVGGREVLALGTDFDGIPKRNLETEDASEMPKLSEYMLSHGFSSSEVEDIFYRNVMRLYRETLR